MFITIYVNISVSPTSSRILLSSTWLPILLLHLYIICVQNVKWNYLLTKKKKKKPYSSYPQDSVQTTIISYQLHCNILIGLPMLMPVSPSQSIFYRASLLKFLQSFLLLKLNFKLFIETFKTPHGLDPFLVDFASYHSYPHQLFLHSHTASDCFWNTSACWKQDPIFLYFSFCKATTEALHINGLVLMFRSQYSCHLLERTFFLCKFVKYLSL